MDVYQLSCDLKPGVRDYQFLAALDGYLGAQRAGRGRAPWRQFPRP